MGWSDLGRGMPVLYESVDRYLWVLAMPERMIRLHTAKTGNSGDASPSKDS